jgi:hypothetical protein
MPANAGQAPNILNDFLSFSNQQNKKTLAQWCIRPVLALLPYPHETMRHFEGYKVDDRTRPGSTRRKRKPLSSEGLIDFISLTYYSMHTVLKVATFAMLFSSVQPKDAMALHQIQISTTTNSCSPRYFTIIQWTSRVGELLHSHPHWGLAAPISGALRIRREICRWKSRIISNWMASIFWILVLLCCNLACRCFLYAVIWWLSWT